MTFREKAYHENPFMFVNGKCPCEFGYESEQDSRNACKEHRGCFSCWEREIPDRKFETNEHQLRNMNIRELAWFLEKVSKRFICPQTTRECVNCLGEDCADCWYDWLKRQQLTVPHKQN